MKNPVQKVVSVVLVAICVSLGALMDTPSRAEYYEEIRRESGPGNYEELDELYRTSREAEPHRNKDYYEECIDEWMCGPEEVYELAGPPSYSEEMCEDFGDRNWYLSWYCDAYAY